VSSAYASATGPSAAAAVPAVQGAPLGATVTAFPGRIPSLPWYAASDFVHTRDAVFLATATPVLRGLLDRHHGTVTVASYQGGMVISAWQQALPGRLRFIDMDDVVTTDFSSCPGLRETYGGDEITLAAWAHDAGTCAPALPDLVFFVGAPSEFQGLLGKYRVVSFVNVRYRPRRLFGEGATLAATEFLAARKGWSR
jgi:hypothetical protein